MFTLIRRGNRKAVVVAGAIAALLAAGTGLGAVASDAAVTPQAASRTAAGPAMVPWSQVGPGWSLALVTKGTPLKPAASTLYLASPAGVKYTVFRWSATTPVPRIVSWSPAKTEALVQPSMGSLQTYELLNLKTGKVAAKLTVPDADGVQFTVPDGKQILAFQVAFAHNGARVGQTLTLYTLAGKRVKTIYGVAGPNTEGAYLNPVYSPDGSKIAISLQNRKIGVLSSAGGAVKPLPVPADTTKTGCWPDRWWDVRTILAYCGSTKGNAYGQVWLVPVSGAKPRALTPAGIGYIGAWQVKSGLYVQYQGNDCTSDRLDKLAKNGSATRLTVPGLAAPMILTSDGTRFLLATGYCPSNTPVLWYNPGTQATQVVFRNAYQIVMFTSDQDVY